MSEATFNPTLSRLDAEARAELAAFVDQHREALADEIESLMTKAALFAAVIDFADGRQTCPPREVETYIRNHVMRLRQRQAQGRN